MRRSLLLASAFLALSAWHGLAQKPTDPQWIWFDEGNPLASAPAETRYFRRAFEINRPVPNPIDAATLEITADNRFVVWVNGVRVGDGDRWETVRKFDVKKHLVHGKNAIAVEATNEGGPAGLVVKLAFIPNGMSGQLLLSDATWMASKKSADGWQKVEFDDSKWARAKALGEYGKVGPWTGAAVKAGPRRFTVPDGFRVEEVVKDPGDRGPFSLVNMTFDHKGRLLLSDERNGILVAEKPDDKGVFQAVREYCTLVKGCHGMCSIDGDLYLVGNGPKGTGLYRCRDTKKADVIDEATLLHRFEGGMGEHGPHAVIHGPDGWLYVVAGNHAWLRVGKGYESNAAALAANSPLLRWPTGGQGPDQGKPGSTEDVLLPRLDDARGHAAGIRAPGGTIWRMDLGGKNLSLVTAGFRNQFDAAFNPAGELFSFDSDMEWDEALPWYRAVRILHCPPGADFVWRTGAANTPNYYFDSLPPLHETGRGSPVGVCGYDHPAFGPRYRGAVFCADWSIGVLYALLPKVNGATYGGEVVKFCTGTPMNITDVEAGPDGAVYFTLGGRGTAGGVYRIVAEKPAGGLHTLADRTPEILAHRIATLPQPQAAWSRARVAALLAGKTWDRKEVAEALVKLAANDKYPAEERVAALAAIPTHGMKAEPKAVRELLHEKDESVRAQAVWLLGLVGDRGDVVALERLLTEPNPPFVKRRACEALIRLGTEPKVEAVWPLLASTDPYLRTAARLVIERIEPAKWIDRVKSDRLYVASWQAIVALCKTGKAATHADVVFTRLAQSVPSWGRESNRVDWLRTVQLACFHVAKPPAEPLAKIARECDTLFPRANPAVNRELAILLAHFRRTGVLKTAVHAKLIDAILHAKADRQQQIHYFYCLRFLHDGWTPDEQLRLAAWYESTRDWKGGHSFTPFLENIFRECLSAYDVKARNALISKIDDLPQVNLVLAQRLGIDRAPEMLATVKKAFNYVADKNLPRVKELQAALSDAALKTVIEHPKADYLPDLIVGLSSPNKVTVFECLAALQKVEAKPKPEDAAAYRAVLLAAGKLDPGNRWKAVEVLRHWSGGRQFGGEKWEPELKAWTRWFAQAFPKERPLPGLVDTTATPSKYKYDELLAYVTTGPGKSGDAKKGRAVFEKGSCLKCHKYGKEGEGVGPDLTTLSKRFKRADTLESLYYPSKVISDQYRSTAIVTKRGIRIEGLVAITGDQVTVLQQDATKVTLRLKDVEQRYASLTSVMPEKTLDALTLAEIADLFAFLESEPAK